jgi:hypothetical protein
MANLCGCVGAAQDDQLDETVSRKADMQTALSLHCVVSHGYTALRLCGTVSHRGGSNNFDLLSESPSGFYGNITKLHTGLMINQK